MSKYKVGQVIVSDKGGWKVKRVIPYNNFEIYECEWWQDGSKKPDRQPQFLNSKDGTIDYSLNEAKKSVDWTGFSSTGKTRSIKEVTQEIQYKHEEELKPVVEDPGPLTPEELNQSPEDFINEDVVKEMGFAG